MTQSDTIRRASGYYNMGIGEGGVSDEQRREAAKKAMRAIPGFSIIGGEVDTPIAADLLIHAIGDTFEHLLDVLMRARPSFSSDAAHMLFTIEAARGAAHQISHFAEAVLPSVAHSVGKFRDTASPEVRKKLDEVASKRALEMMEELLGAATMTRN